MRSAAIVVALEPPDSVDARWCLGEYFKEIAARFESGFDPTKRGAGVSAEEMTPPTGLFFPRAARWAPVQCGALKRIGNAGEIKRM